MANTEILSISSDTSCLRSQGDCKVVLTYKDAGALGQCNYQGTNAGPLIEAGTPNQICGTLKGDAEEAVSFERKIFEIVENVTPDTQRKDELRRLAKGVWSYIRLGQGNIREILYAHSDDPNKLDFILGQVTEQTVGPKGEDQAGRFREFVRLAKNIKAKNKTSFQGDGAYRYPYEEQNVRAPSSPYKVGTRIEWQESQVRERDCPEGDQLYTYIFTGTVQGKAGESGCDPEMIPVKEDKKGDVQCLPLGEESKIFKIPEGYQPGKSLYMSPKKSKCLAFVPVANFTALWPVARFSQDSEDYKNNFALRGGLAIGYPKYNSPAAVGFFGVEGVATTFNNENNAEWKWGPSFGGGMSFGGFKGSAISFGPLGVVSPVFGDGKVIPVLELGANSTIVGLVSVNAGCQLFGDQAFLCGLGAGFTPLIFGE